MRKGSAEWRRSGTETPASQLCRRKWRKFSEHQRPQPSNIPTHRTLSFPGPMKVIGAPTLPSGLTEGLTLAASFGALPSGSRELLMVNVAGMSPRAQGL